MTLPDSCEILQQCLPESLEIVLCQSWERELQGQSVDCWHWTDPTTPGAEECISEIKQASAGTGKKKGTHRQNHRLLFGSTTFGSSSVSLPSGALRLRLLASESEVEDMSSELDDVGGPSPAACPLLEETGILFELRLRRLRLFFFFFFSLFCFFISASALPFSFCDFFFLCFLSSLALFLAFFAFSSFVR